MYLKKSAFLLVIVSLILTLIIPLAGCANAPSTAVVSLDSGKIRGTLTGGVGSYLGIPYAAPPVGDLRWREPQPVKPWDGIRDANKLGPACPQPKTILYNVGDQNEDCLYLNVWSPAKSPDDKLPVMFWIHGGGFTTGSGGQAMYDGKALAGHNVIIVTFNYRLGPLGFLAHPQLSKESTHGTSGNYGLLDQVYALKWVQRNIKAFGGDSSNVTIFGESAGGRSVIDLMVSPLTDGLFVKAISESGNFPDAYPRLADDTVARAEKTGMDMAASLGCDKAADPLACMRQKSPDDIVKVAFAKVGAMGSGKYQPVIDGWVIPSNPWSIYTDEKQKKVPLLIGTNQNEGSIFVMPDLNVQKMSVEDYVAYVKSTFNDNADAVLAKFPAPDKSAVVGAMTDIDTVMGFWAGALHAADTQSALGSPVYIYRFTHVADTLLKPLGIGAFHGSEIFFVFGNFKGDNVSIPDTTSERQLSSDLMQYWTNFAKTGDPNGQGLPQWQTFSTATGNYIELGDQPVAKTGFMQEYRALIDQATK